MFPNPCFLRGLGRVLGIVIAACIALPGASRPAHADGGGTIVTIARGLAQPRTAAVAANGDIYFTDTYHHRISRLDRSGKVTVIAGTGTAGDSGDGGPATEAKLDTPHGVAVDNRGNVFIADSPNHRIRKVDLATGVITTVAGTGQEGYSGDGGPATAARLNRPRFLVIARDGSLIIADTANYRVRRVDPSGVITTIAGNGERGYSGDGGPATAARLDDPRGLAFDDAGNLYVSNAEGSPVPSVRRIAPGGTITTVAGGREAGFGGDGGQAVDARLHEPRSIAVWRSTLYVADSMNDRIRAVDLRSGLIRTVAGTGAAAYGGDGGPASAAKIAEPRGVAVDGDGDVIVIDTGNNRLRRIDLGGAEPPAPPAPPAPASGAGPDASPQTAGKPGPAPAATAVAPSVPGDPSPPAQSNRPATARKSSRPTATSPRPTTPPTTATPPSSVTSTSMATPSTTAAPAAPASTDRQFAWRADLGPVASGEPMPARDSSSNERWYPLVLLAAVPFGYAFAASKAARTAGGISTDSAAPGLTET